MAAAAEVAAASATMPATSARAARRARRRAAWQQRPAAAVPTATWTTIFRSNRSGEQRLPINLITSSRISARGGKRLAPHAFLDPGATGFRALTLLDVNDIYIRRADDVARRSAWAWLTRNRSPLQRARDARWDCHEFLASARCRPCDPRPCVCRDGGVCPRARAIRRSQGHAAAPDARLDLGRADGTGGAACPWERRIARARGQ